jgi:hypothetical protein
MNKNYKAIIVGILIVTISCVVALGVLYKSNDTNIGFLMWGAIVFAGFSTAFFAKSHKMLLALLLALPTALIFACANLVWQLLGKPSDFPGAHGFLIVIGTTLPLALALSGLGGLVGCWYRKKRT